MKKITLAILMTFGIFTMVSADIGVKLGVSAQIGLEFLRWYLQILV